MRQPNGGNLAWLEAFVASTPWPEHCVLFPGREERAGEYGNVRVAGKIALLYMGDSPTIRAHVAAWLLAFGPVPRKMDVRHTCAQRACCNPGHLKVEARAAMVKIPNAPRVRSRPERAERATTPRDLAARACPQDVGALPAHAERVAGTRTVTTKHGTTYTVQRRQPNGSNLAWLETLAASQPWPEHCIEFPGGGTRAGPTQGPRAGSLGYGIVRVTGKLKALCAAGVRGVNAHTAAWLLAFGPVPVGLEVLHTCKQNRRCCNPGHLKVGTHAENMADKARDGTSARGERQHLAKLTDDAVREIRRRHGPPERATQAALAREYGVGHVCIMHVVQRVTWKHVLDVDADT